ncbi:MAG: HAMP domain-containing histidine kinase, partial [Terrimicrobiaceae bacterium]|nr:HAMP domain-containing histidine kinase [Terrimicrobiaceae bacterium]
GVAAPPPDLQPLDLREIAGRVVKGAAQRAAEKGLSIELAGPAAPAPAIGDPESTSRILENLLSNALKFCPPGAKIEIETGPGWAEVRDNGPGIPESERPNLFKKFRRGANLPTAGEDSSGLGLYIAHSLALRMNGSLEFAPSASGGSAFRLTLPLT